MKCDTLNSRCCKIRSSVMKPGGLPFMHYVCMTLYVYVLANVPVEVNVWIIPSTLHIVLYLVMTDMLQ